ncbi:hypothetical protein FACS189434_09870 [Bacteroidia bacterium]|nr:hypothetical protein FACS189434_09870 [Bacteroidia bacterium]
MAGINANVSAQSVPNLLTGQATIGEDMSLSGGLAITNGGELYLGSHEPRGQQIYQLNIFGNYVGEAGSKIFHSITANSNAHGTRGFLDISGVALRTDGGTTVELDMDVRWDGSRIDLIRASREGSDKDAFRMDEQNYGGHIAALFYEEYGNDIIWYIGEKFPNIFEDCLPVIHQKLNNTLIVDDNSATNGGYKFTHYVWYKRSNNADELLKDDDHEHLGGHYYTGGASLDPYSEYWAKLITTAGDTLVTCMFRPTIKVKQSNLIAYPNPVRQGMSNIVYVKVDVDDTEALNAATIDVYDMSGRFFGRTAVTGRTEVPVTMPVAPGVYVLQFKSDTISKNILIMVEN